MRFVIGERVNGKWSIDGTAVLLPGRIFTTLGLLRVRNGRKCSSEKDRKGLAKQRTSQFGGRLYRTGVSHGGVFLCQRARERRTLIVRKTRKNTYRKRVLGRWGARIVNQGIVLESTVQGENGKVSLPW